jgi:hypothetical protein
MPKFVTSMPAYLHLCPFCGESLDYPKGHLDQLFLRNHLPTCVEAPPEQKCVKCERLFVPSDPATQAAGYCRTCKPVRRGTGRLRTCEKCQRRFRGLFALCGRCRGTCWRCEKARGPGRTRRHRRHRFRKSKCLWHCSRQELRDIFLMAERAIRTASGPAGATVEPAEKKCVRSDSVASESNPTSTGGPGPQIRAAGGPIDQIRGMGVGQIRGTDAWCSICGVRCQAHGPTLCRHCIEDAIIATFRLGKSSILISDWLASLDRSPFSLHDSVLDAGQVIDRCEEMSDLERFLES